MTDLFKNHQRRLFLISLGLWMIFVELSLFSFASETISSEQKILPSENEIYHGANPDFGGTEDVVTTKRITDFETLAGKKIVWAYFSNNWIDGIHFPKEEVETIHDAGKIPFIRMMPRSQWSDWGGDPVYTLNRFLKGRFDKALRQWAQDAKATNIPLLVEFGTEVNGAWFPWNGKWNGGGKTTNYGNPTEPDGPERFRDTYRHIVNLFRDEGVQNITWVFHVDAYSYPETKWNSIKNYYPGDDYIDWIGVSIYGPQEPGEHWWQSFPEILEDCYDELAALSPNKPIAILEFGVVDYPEMGSKSDWIRDAFTTLRNQDYPRIKAISYWNETFTNDDGSVSNLRIDSSPESLQAYREEVADPIFLETLSSSSAGADIPPTQIDPNLLSEPKNWNTLYTGYGVVDFLNGEVYLEPMTSTQLYETHAALTISNCQVKDFSATITTTTHKQLRKNYPPNAWEVFWIFFNYENLGNNEKKTNYFILKPNGTELGTAFDSAGQYFLFTAGAPQLSMEQMHTYEIKKIGQNLTIRIDGNTALNYNGNVGPYPLYDQLGAIGLYVEDAATTVHSVIVEPLDNLAQGCHL